VADIFRVSKDTEKAIQEIVRKINEIERKLLVNPNRGVTVDSQGAVGTQRVETVDGVTVMKVKTKDGWKQLNEDTKSKWLAGEGLPTNDMGVVGDFYLDVDTKNVYKKEINGWL